MPNLSEEKGPISPTNLLKEAALAGDIEQIKELLYICTNYNKFLRLKSSSDKKLADDKEFNIKEESIFNELDYIKLLEEIIIKMRINTVKKQNYLNIIKIIIAYGIDKNFNPPTCSDVFKNAILNLEYNAALDLKIDIELICLLSQVGFYNWSLVKIDESTHEFYTAYKIMHNALDEDSFNQLWEKITQDVILHHIIKTETIHLNNIILLLEEKCNFKLVYDKLIRKLRFKEKDYVCKEFKAYGRKLFSEKQRKNILRAVLQHTSLETLLVDREFIGENIKLFIRYLANNTTLTHLKLHRFSDFDLKQIAKDMYNNSTLQSLTIEDSGSNLKKYKIKNKSTPLPDILNGFKYLKSLAIQNTWAESKVNAEMPFLLESHNYLVDFSFYNLGEKAEEQKIKYEEWFRTPSDFKGIDLYSYVMPPILFQKSHLEKYCSSVISNMVKFNQQLCKKYELEIKKWLMPIFAISAYRSIQVRIPLNSIIDSTFNRSIVTI